jgi:hypothetical protein
VGAEASSGRDRIIVADPHWAEGCIIRIIEIAKREDMTALQPAMIEPVCRFCRIDCYQCDPLLKIIYIIDFSIQANYPKCYLQCSRKLRKQEETGTIRKDGIRFSDKQQGVL